MPHQNAEAGSDAARPHRVPLPATRLSAEWNTVIHAVNAELEDPASLCSRYFAAAERIAASQDSNTPVEGLLRELQRARPDPFPGQPGWQILWHTFVRRPLNTRGGTYAYPVNIFDSPPPTLPHAKGRGDERDYKSRRSWQPAEGSARASQTRSPDAEALIRLLNGDLRRRIKPLEPGELQLREKLNAEQYSRVTNRLRKEGWPLRSAEDQKHYARILSGIIDAPQRDKLLRTIVTLLARRIAIQTKAEAPAAFPAESKAESTQLRVPIRPRAEPWQRFVDPPRTIRDL
jgi:hypothetical protein